jgi:hypothetical protein
MGINNQGLHSRPRLCCCFGSGFLSIKMIALTNRFEPICRKIHNEIYGQKFL